jgi:hypothetical protein
MSTLSPVPARVDDGARLLRFALRLDAAASGALGLLGLAAAPLLAELLGPPSGVLAVLGGFLVGYAAALVLLAARPRIPRPAGWTVVAGNAAWVAGSVLATAVGWNALTGLGVVVTLAQAGAVAGFAALQTLGLRR